MTKYVEFTENMDGGDDTKKQELKGYQQHIREFRSIGIIRNKLYAF